MDTEQREKALEIMKERYGKDTIISLATISRSRGIPSVRMMNSLYVDGSFYTITYALSTKIKQITVNPAVGLCAEWFTAHGIGENMGWIRLAENAAIADKLRHAFAAWYDNGHTDEEDHNTVILRIKLTDGILASHGTFYHIDFTEKA